MNKTKTIKTIKNFIDILPTSNNAPYIIPNECPKENPKSCEQVVTAFFWPKLSLSPAAARKLIPEGNRTGGLIMERDMIDFASAGPDKCLLPPLKAVREAGRASAPGGGARSQGREGKARGGRTAGAHEAHPCLVSRWLTSKGIA